MLKNELLELIANGEGSGVEFKRDDIRPKEVLPVARTDINSLDFSRLENYFRDILKDPDMPDSPEAWRSRLNGMSFLTTIDGQEYATIAGLVLFGKKPRRWLKQSGLRVFVFSDIEKTYDALLDEMLDAPLVGRWDIHQGEKTLIDAGLVEQLMMHIKPFIRIESAQIDESLRRTSEWLFPIEVIREVVLNALIHRDWTRSVDIEIGIYRDRLEVISPGALHNSMTIEKMLAGQRSPRNTLIVEVMRDYGYVDFRGMGIRNKVIPMMKAFNGTLPVFEATEDYVKTTLFRTTLNANNLSVS